QRATAYSGPRRSDSDALHPEKGSVAPSVGGAAVVVVYDAALGIDRSRLNDLLTAGPAAGVHVLWLDASFGGLPARAGASVVVRRDAAQADVGLVSTGRTTSASIETLSVARAEELALRLAPLADASNRLDAS